MKKISENAAKAFKEGRPFKRGNTRVEVHPDRVSMFLFGNEIAKREYDILLRRPVTRVRNAGWFSVTTKDRLNALLSSHFFITQRNFIWFLGDRVWNGDWITIE